VPKWKVILLIVCLVIGPWARADAVDREGVRAFVDVYIHEQLARHHVAGAAFVLVDESGVAISRGYGYSDVIHQERVDPASTVWAVGSLSKPVTATAVMQLVERGKLDLHADVNDYLGGLTFDRIGRAVTLHDLLTHTAGFDPIYRGIGARSVGEVQALGEYLKTHRPPRIEPGRMINYSNYGFAVAGRAVEVGAGEDFAAYVERNIFAPAGMTHSSFRPREATTGYQREGVQWTAVPTMYMQETPACGMTTTMEDLGRFMLMQLRDGTTEHRRVLSAESVRAMQRVQFSHHPALAGWTYGFAERTAGGLHAIEHGGVRSGVTCKMLMVPDKKVGFVVAYNAYDPPLLDEISRPVLEKIFGAEATRTEALAASSAKADERVAGYYRSAWYSHGTIEKLRILWKPLGGVIVRADGHVEIREGKDVTELVAVGDGVYEPVRGGARVAFRFGSNDRATHMFVGNCAYERAGWWETPGVQLFGFVVFSVCFCGATGWLIGRKLMGWRVRRMRGTRLTSAASCGINGLCLGTLAFLLVGTDQRELVLGVPAMLVAVLLLAKVGAMMAVVHALVAGFNWMRGQGTRGRRIRHAALAMMSAAFVPFMLYWNLL
jgi:CubicO group peptidase (beta-lactamase class C family)